MPQKIPTPKKFISIRFNEKTAPEVFKNQTVVAETGLPALKTFKLAVPAGQEAQISVEAAGWPFTYDPTWVWFLNESWATGTTHLAVKDTTGPASVKSAAEIEFTYDKAKKTISWKQASTSGSMKLDLKLASPTWYVTLRLAKAANKGDLLIAGKPVVSL